MAWPREPLLPAHLSDGGKDESVIREFDAVEKKFVEGGFSILKARQCHLD
jgi:prolyl oligopeptidase PreP (S9A serine peptidase family)